MIRVNLALDRIPPRPSGPIGSSIGVQGAFAIFLTFVVTMGLMGAFLILVR